MLLFQWKKLQTTLKKISSMAILFFKCSARFGKCYAKRRKQERNFFKYYFSLKSDLI